MLKIKPCQPGCNYCLLIGDFYLLFQGPLASFFGGSCRNIGALPVHYSSEGESAKWNCNCPDDFD